MRQSAARAMLLASVVALPLACGGGGGDDGPTGNQPSISVAVAPGALTVQQGGSGQVTITLTRSNFTAPVSLSVSGLPAGVTTALSPDQLTGATASATVTVNVASTVAPGAYTATIRASAAGVGEATTTYALTVTAAPNYALALTPATLSIAQGASGTSAVAITRTNFTGAVALSLANPPAGITGSFAPASATGDASTLTVNVGAAVAPGSYTLTVQGAGDPVGARTATLALTVTASASYTLSANPTSISLAPGGSGTATINIARATGFAGAVTLALESPPAGITASFNPASVTADVSTMTITVAATVAAGSYTVTVKGTAAGVTDRTTQVTVVVAAAAFTISPSPTALSIQQGASGTSTVTIGRTNFTGAVTLALDAPPPGVTGTFAPGSTTGTTSTFTVNVAGNTPAGAYVLTIRGTSSGQTDRTATINLTVTAAPGSIAIALSPAAVSVAQGATGGTTVNLTRTNFTDNVTLAATGQPGGVTVAFTPNPTTASTSTATVTVSAGVATGNYPITITASGTGVTSVSATLTLTVTSPQSGGNAEWQFCSAADTPVFFAYQDGTGAWQRVLPATSGTVTKFTFNLSQNRGGVLFVLQTTTSLVARDASEVSSRNKVLKVRSAVARARTAQRLAQGPARARRASFARQSLATTYATEVFYGTATELTMLGVDNCNNTQPTKTINGNVNGVGPTQAAVLSLGESGQLFLGATGATAVQFPNVRFGTVDFVGTRFSGNTPDKIVLFRNLNIPDGGSLPQTIDFNAASAFAPATASATVNNSLGELLSLSSSIITANGENSFSLGDQPSTDVLRTWTGLPANQMVSGDIHGLFLSSVPNTTTFTSARILLKYVGAVTNQTLDLGPNLNTPTVTALAIGAYPRLRIQGTLPVEYRQAVAITINEASFAGNSYSITATGAYLTVVGSNSLFDLTMPDVAGLNGFPAASRLSPGANDVSVSGVGFTGQGITSVRPNIGDVLRAAFRIERINVS